MAETASHAAPSTAPASLVRLAPLLVALAAAIPLVASKATIFVLMAGTLAALLLGWSHLKALPRPGGATLAMLAFAVYAMASALWSAAPWMTLDKGAQLLGVVVGAYVLLEGLRRLPLSMTLPLASWFVTGFALAMIYLAAEIATDFRIMRFGIETLGLNPQGSMVKMAGRAVEWINPAIGNWGVACMNLLLWPVLLMVTCLTSGRRRWLMCAALVALALVTTLRSEHETSVVAIAATLVVFPLALYALKFVRVAATAAWVLFTLAMPLVGYIGYHKLQLHLSSSVPPSGQARFIVWGYTAEKIAERPLLGVGVRSTRVAWQAQGRGGRPELLPGHNYPRSTAQHAHNVFMSVWYELGAVGAGLLCIAGLFCLRAMARLDTAVQPYAYATFAVAAIQAASTWELWQVWFPAAYALTAAAMLFGARVWDGARLTANEGANAVRLRAFDLTRGTKAGLMLAGLAAALLMVMAKRLFN